MSFTFLKVFKKYVESARSVVLLTPYAYNIYIIGILLEFNSNNVLTCSQNRFLGSVSVCPKWFSPTSCQKQKKRIHSVSCHHIGYSKPSKGCFWISWSEVTFFGQTEVIHILESFTFLRLNIKSVRSLVVHLTLGVHFLHDWNSFLQWILKWSKNIFLSSC